MTSEDALLDTHMQGSSDLQAYVSRAHPGIWDPAWVQPAVNTDPDDAPEEHCSCCGEYISYYWVKEAWLYRQWGQDGPFWLRMGCERCGEVRESFAGYASEAYEPEI